MEKQERLKKILIIIVALSLFGTSYYYYVHKQKKTSVKTPQKAESKQPVKKVKEVKKVVSVKPEPVKKVSNITKKVEEKIEKKVEKKVEQPEVIKPKKVGIKPTNRADLLKAAAGTSGKYDPFSYTESNYIPYDMRQKADSGNRKVGSLPAPPGISGAGQPENFVEIRGFMGNKVIAEVNGMTEALKEGDSLRGIVVLKVDSENLTCELKVDGKKVTKKMKPIAKPDKTTEINYIQ